MADTSAVISTGVIADGLHAWSSDEAYSLMLVEGPAVLGTGEMARIERSNAERDLREGLMAAMSATGREELDLGFMTTLLSAAFDRAAVAIDDGADPGIVKRTMTVLVERLVRS